MLDRDRIREPRRHGVSDLEATRDLLDLREVCAGEEHLAAYDLWENRKRLFQRPKDGWW